MGWIACNNVISDMYAMGCTRIDNVLMLLATSTKFSSVEDETVIPMIMSGFRDCCFAAGTQVRGGQTARNPWVLLGGCATSVLPKEKFIMPTGAKVGDVLILTKPFVFLADFDVWFGRNQLFLADVDETCCFLFDFDV